MDYNTQTLSDDAIKPEQKLLFLTDKISKKIAPQPELYNLIRFVDSP